VARSKVRDALVEAVRITIAGGCIAAALGILRGVPSIEELRADDPATCGVPVAQRPEVQWIDPAEARALVGDTEVTFVDARARQDYEAGHVAGAVSVPIDTGAIDDRSTGLVRGSRVVITYCDTSGECAQSKRLAEVLASAGLPDVRVLRGGMPAWLESEYPAEAGPCRVCP
jgi:rhodanese-related sulfurtransferase